LNASQEIVTEINSQPKWDRLQEEAYSRLPYHPQFLPANTLLSAQLKEPLAFGIETIATSEIAYDWGHEARLCRCDGAAHSQHCRWPDAFALRRDRRKWKWIDIYPNF
jgi:hypothetical protein